MQLNAKGALLTAAAIVLLFGGIELYGLFGDWTILNPTVACQLLALTVAVTPMMYGMIWASHHSDGPHSKD
jgi:hypothetical protein